MFKACGCEVSVKEGIAGDLPGVKEWEVTVTSLDQALQTGVGQVCVGVGLV